MKNINFTKLYSNHCEGQEKQEVQNPFASKRIPASLATQTDASFARLSPCFLYSLWFPVKIFVIINHFTLNLNISDSAKSYFNFFINFLFSFKISIFPFSPTNSGSEFRFHQCLIIPSSLLSKILSS